METKVADLTVSELRTIIRDEVTLSMQSTGFNVSVQDLDTRGQNRPLPAENEFVDINTAVEVLGLSKSTIYKMVGANKIPYSKQGPKKLLFKRADLKKWLNDNIALDKNGTAPDGWNEKLQGHFIYEQPSSGRFMS
ncbi:helix-turn-helix domain-containing protein [Mucilaginibacter sp. KACC 22773]|uniref:helix-turn-helix transcriptional regulator n=1 Tax=Mucilaginibacter sp. KACC 22773 TaxID=3025671 RepID=UPI00236625B0|nr:helix-turn-helix domain-containing protein [Mucilaginibacter sp. KACC 22773]WDF79536.1 helix-turn-helix domain-containing protein [Mucilaginibacter sp. KACC 22773]